MVEMAVGLGAVSRPLKDPVINIFTMPYAAGCPLVLTLYSHTHSVTHSLINQTTHQPAWTYCDYEFSVRGITRIPLVQL